MTVRRSIPAIRRALPRSGAAALLVAAAAAPGQTEGAAKEAGAEPPTLEEETIGLRIRRPQRAFGEPADVEFAGPQVPLDSFTGEVTRIHQSIHDRQIIALDNSYLFTSETARQARFKVGQSVEVRKQKSRFGSGRTWRIVGPSKRTVEAIRIRCERPDINSDDRRRCDRMIGK